MADDLGRDGAENQVRGGAEELKGRLRDAAGSLTGDSEQELKGKAEQLKGKVQRKIGEAETDADRDI